MKSLFIVFEGIDGSGTSTQANLLKEYFITQNQSAILSPEPTTGVIGKLIREAMQSSIIPIQDKKKFDEQMAYLFAADRHYHIYNDVDGILKLTQQDHCHVITTRYYFSSLAYNCNTLEEFQFVSQLNAKFPQPDVVIYLDISVQVSLNRIAERQLKEVYENEEKLNHVRENFINIFSEYEGNKLIINGQDTIENIHQQIIQYLEGIAVSKSTP
ncbi:dTMP kinase [Aphanothece hegewaldii CCALA 016]|uniref:Thymidylate kinase n=1 Tax=Aphanothece hegewaldii CCALA 016 TaxID=2107694 RepID=A0A2T1M015_9CHRO|nr:dTMP kinase [Aphanothece hegewaldii]PSF38019.1 dTMP kinase [Aphanothece hegewaldii CCALA 016]